MQGNRFSLPAHKWSISTASCGDRQQKTKTENGMYPGCPAHVVSAMYRRGGQGHRTETMAVGKASSRCFHICTHRAAFVPFALFSPLPKNIAPSCIISRGNWRVTMIKSHGFCLVSVSYYIYHIHSYLCLVSYSPQKGLYLCWYVGIILRIDSYLCLVSYLPQNGSYFHWYVGIIFIATSGPQKGS